jgi:hypothetical protein
LRIGSAKRRGGVRFYRIFCIPEMRIDGDEEERVAVSSLHPPGRRRRSWKKFHID